MANKDDTYYMEKAYNNGKDIYELKELFENNI